MNSGNSNSAASSEPTSANKPQTPASEADFLTQQANDASAAIAGAVAALKQDLLKSADPRLWTKEYPWASVAAAAVGGFVAASMVVPTKEEQALKRLERIERALHPERNGQSAAVDGATEKKDRGILGSILTSAIKTLQPILISTITGAVSGKMAQPDPEDMAAAADRRGTV
jgi:hypothetical protein